MWFTSFTIFSVHKESFHFINVVDMSALHVSSLEHSTMHVRLSLVP